MFVFLAYLTENRYSEKIMDWFEFKIRHLKFLCVLFDVILLNLVDGGKMY